jgi:two-component system NarL family response regulator
MKTQTTEARRKPETRSKRSAIRVLIADDHPIVRDGLAAIINSEPDMSVVAEAGDGRQAIELFRLHHPSVVLMDLRMPQMSGVEAIDTISKEYPDSRIIVLSTYDADDDIYRAIHAGARAYLLKDASHEELLTAIRAVNGGARRVSSHATARLAEHRPSHDLTGREVQILKLIAKGKSNKLIGVDLGITEGTVKGHVNAILTKLGVSDRTEAVTTALRRRIIQLD